MTFQFHMQEGEYWWGGSTYEGFKMPFDAKTSYAHDFRRKCWNQGSPFSFRARDAISGAKNPSSPPFRTA